MLRPAWFFAGVALAILHWQAAGLAQEKQSPTSGSEAQQPKLDETEIPLGPPEAGPAAKPSNPKPPEVTLPNFVSSSLAELRRAVPELKELKAAPDLTQLSTVLDKIGAVIVENVRKTPDLISHEAVISEEGSFKDRENYSYLVLTRPMGKEVVFDEFRVDLATGAKFETGELEKAAIANSRVSSSPSDLPSSADSIPNSDRAPISQGFVTSWLHFYPLNRPRSIFRLLGEEKINGHHTIVVAFAQKPKQIPLPAKILYEGKTFPVFLQGVAWVDASDFRIVRLRTDLLDPVPGAQLWQLTASTDFAQTRIPDMSTPLWLPREVAVTTKLGGVTVHETHKYSNYHLFRTHSKIVY